MDDLLCYLQGNALEVLLTLHACEEARGREKGESATHAVESIGLGQGLLEFKLCLCHLLNLLNLYFFSWHLVIIRVILSTGEFVVRIK